MIHGIINVYKERGFTSHDVVAKLRRITGQKKIGHTGTLDPEAEGVLPVCFGRATKLCDMLTDRDKCYEAVLLLGVRTDTQDVFGKVIREEETGELAEDSVRSVIGSFKGKYEQIPPMYSALKVNGKKLCDLAREGKTVERKARTVEIYDIRIDKIKLPRVHMKVHCSKGTYIRTLCHDIGEKLGCGGCMESLIRTRSGIFEIKESVTLWDIEKKIADGNTAEIIYPVDGMFSEYKALSVMEGWEKLIYNGNPLPKECVSWEQSPEDLEEFRVYDRKGEFVGIYRYEGGQERLVIVKMFYSGER
ncbi:tRNA pseudouridine(55) synthase TruB [Lachnospiraceae bacterium 42-17]|jgi:tRNA pseudouridine55 synthase|nr:tRNA pseudouridine(55) synthase TruB [Dorea sp.]